MRSRLVDQVPRAVQADLSRLGRGIREARLAKGVTQQQLATRLQVSRKTVHAAEQGNASVTVGIFLTLLWSLGIGPLAAVLEPGHSDAAAPTRQRVRPKALDEF